MDNIQSNNIDNDSGFEKPNSEKVMSVQNKANSKSYTAFTAAIIFWAISVFPILIFLYGLYAFLVGAFQNDNVELSGLLEFIGFVAMIIGGIIGFPLIVVGFVFFEKYKKQNISSSNTKSTYSVQDNSQSNDDKYINILLFGLMLICIIGLIAIIRTALL